MKQTLLILLFLLFAGACRPDRPESEKPAPDDLSGRNSFSIREPADPVGYAHDQKVLERLVSLSEKLEGSSFEARGAETWVAGISPHDDHLYASRVTIHLFPGLKAKRVLFFGVCHKAKKFGIENVLVFDQFSHWKAPYGPMKVSSLREMLLERIDSEDYLVSNEVHDSEHSVEGLLHFLQHYNRSAELTAILVPHMNWDRLEALAWKLATALAAAMKEQRWTLGRDLALVFSNDCVHYGDEGWGEKTYADFGVDRQGYEKAKARDLGIIRETLEGPLSKEKIRNLYFRLVDGDTLEYKITWCGRFSVPFGLACLYRLCEILKRPQPSGTLLRYGTTFEEGELDLKERGSLGVTAPKSLRHWVGFCSVGYR